MPFLGLLWQRKAGVLADNAFSFRGLPEDTGYQFLRALNQVHYSVEAGMAIASGREPVMRRRVDRGDKATELVGYIGVQWLFHRLLPSGSPTLRPMSRSGEFQLKPANPAKGDFGLPSESELLRIADEMYAAKAREVGKRTAMLLLRIVRERGQDFLEIGSASQQGEFFRFDDVCIAFGWRSVDEIIARQELTPLQDDLSELGLMRRLKYLERAFSEMFFYETREKILAAVSRRESSFLDKLWRLADLQSTDSDGTS